MSINKTEPTRLVQNKRYPTYQLYAQCANRKTEPFLAMKICVLECMKWLRRRLRAQDDIPEEINLPEPCDYALLKDGQIHSFKLDMGFDIDVIYLKGELWSFHLIEPDMGANIGQPCERPAVKGRLFETNIAFRIVNDVLEIGAATICAQPSDVNEDCEVYRPLVIKQIAENPMVGLKQIWNLKENANVIATNSAFESLCDLIDSKERQLPVMVVTTAIKAPEKKSFEINAAELSKLSPLSAMSRSSGVSDFSRNISISDEVLGKKKLATPVVKQKENRNTDITFAPVQQAPVVLPNIDADKAAKTLVGFTHVCILDDKLFNSLCDYYKLSVLGGDIVIFYDNGSNEIIKYKFEKEDFDEKRRQICDGLKLYPKRNSFTFGNVLFSQDARLYEIQLKRSQNLSRDEIEQLMRDEIRQLRSNLDAERERTADNSVQSEKNRQLEKRINTVTEENDELNNEIEQLKTKIKKLQKALSSASEVADIFRDKAAYAATYPDSADKVKKWVESSFGDTIVMHKNAVQALTKYAEPNLTAICDGILYLHKAMLCRNNEINADALKLYGDEYKWEIQFSGDEAVKTNKKSYTVYDDNNHPQLLNLHIKYGVKPPNWVRIYFYRDDVNGKFVIGYLPDHLPTRNDKT